jgi:hypothetical protein
MKNTLEIKVPETLFSDSGFNPWWLHYELRYLDDEINKSINWKAKTIIVKWYFKK